MNYDYHIKDIVNIGKFFSREKKFNEDKEKSIESIENRRLTSQIKELPCETQKKVYIYAIKKYWKEHVLDTIKIPFWMHYQNYLTKEYSKVILQNVHFLHLDFNTKPENKQYISGCQCEYCISYPQFEKDHQYNQILNGKDHHFDCPSLYDFENLLPTNWFTTYDYTKLTIMPTFDNKRGRYENPIYSSPHDSPMYFSNEIIEKYKKTKFESS